MLICQAVLQDTDGADAEGNQRDNAGTAPAWNGGSQASEGHTEDSGLSSLVQPPVSLHIDCCKCIQPHAAHAKPS